MKSEDQVHVTAPMQSPALGSFPCVLYECNSSFEISYVSSNVFELINLKYAGVLGSRAFSHERVFYDDLPLIGEALKNYKSGDGTSLVHRIVDDSGLCIWIAHSLRKDPAEELDLWRGCIVPIPSEKRLLDLDQGVVSRFMHKIGNHFQLLMLLVGPLKKLLPTSREIHVMEETVEKAVGVAKAFADYSQTPNRSAEISIREVIKNAMNVRQLLFAGSKITLLDNIEDSITDLVVAGDAALLEAAIGNILENAFEATEPEGEITIHAKLESWNANKPAIIVVNILDTGCGIKEEDLSKVSMPFYSTKQNHDGLGLSMAMRFIELHGGTMHVHSKISAGTAVQLTIPLVPIR